MEDKKDKPEELNCLKFLLKTFRFFGMWHKKNDKIAYTIFGVSVWLWQFIYLLMNVFGIIKKAKEWKSISAAFEDLIMGFSSVFSVYKVSVIMSKRDMILRGVDKLNREWKEKYIETDEEEQLMLRGAKFEKKLMSLVFANGQAVIFALILNGISKYKRNVQIWRDEMEITNSTLPFPYETSLPQLTAFPIKDTISYAAMWIHLNWNMILMAQLSLNVDGIIWFWTYHVANYFKILSDKIRRNSISYNRLKGFVKFHKDLISETEDIQKVLGPIMFLQFSISSVMICIALFQITQVDSSRPILYIKHIFYLTFKVVQMFLNCWFSQRLEDMSTDVGSAAYSTNWPDFLNKSTSFMIRMIIIRARKACRISAFGFVNITIKTFMRVIESSYSYFTLLRTF